MKRNLIGKSLPVMAVALLAWNASLIVPAADYATTVLSYNPVAYWRFNETAASPAPNKVLNLGSIGALGDGYVVMDVGKAEPGIVGTAIRLNNVGPTVGYCGSKVDVPFTAALNPTPPFSVEFWAKPNALGSDGTGFCVISDFDPNWYGGGNRSGWLFYLNNNGRWNFRLGLTSGYAGNLLGPNGSASPGAWCYVVGTYDGSQARLYVNGTQVAVANVSGWKPNPQSALRMGGTPLQGNLSVANTAYSSSGIAGNRGFDGWLDEVVFHGTLLSATTIAERHALATSDPAGYAARVLADNPLGYWRMEDAAVTPPDPGILPALANSGSAGAAADGKASWGVEAAQDGPPYAGMGANNKACVFNGEAGQVVLNDAAALHFSGNITVMAWVKPRVKDYFRDILAHGFDTTAYTETFFRISRGFTSDGYGDGNYYEVGVTDGSVYYDSATFPVPAGDTGNWVFLAGTFDGSNWNLYRNGVLVGSSVNANPLGAWDVSLPWSIGSRSLPSDAEGNFFGGAIDEPAIFTTALSAADISAIYNAALVSPVITQAPQNPGTVFKGSSVNLSVWAEGAPPLTYQWSSNGVPTSVTTSNITLANLESGLKTIEVAVSNPYGSVTSTVTFSVVAAPPNIVTQPQSLTRYAGVPFSFTVTAGGSTPLTYTWKLGATVVQAGPSPTFGGVAEAAAAGSYTCTVSNEAGTVDTAAATLTVVPVLPGISAAVIGDSPVAYWRLGEASGTATAFDYCGGHDGTYHNATLGVPGYSVTDPDTAVGFGAINSYVGEISGTEINFKGHVSFSLEVWANGPASQNDESTLIAKGAGSSGTVATEQFSIDVVGGHYRFFTRGGGNSMYAAEAPVGPNGTWQHIVAVYDDAPGGTATMQIYVNGVLAGNGTPRPAGVRDLGVPISIGSKHLGNDPNYDAYFTGTIDEVAIYAVALTSDQIANHYSAAYGANTPPTIGLHPSPVTTYVTLPATFTVAASGTVPMSYQWKKGTANIAGATGSSYTIPGVVAGDTGDYSVVVSNPLGSVASSAAHLTVLPAPTTTVAIPGLALHLPFNNSLVDTTGRGNNGTNVLITATATNIGGAATYVTDGKLGQALHYATELSDTNNPIYSYVTLGLRADLQFGADVNFSVAYWIRPPVNYIGNDLPFFTDTVGSTFGTGFVFAPAWGDDSASDPHPGGWAMSIFDTSGAGAGVYGDTGSINDGNWHHLVHVIERGGNAVTYLDGVVANYRREGGTSFSSAGDITSGQPACIGQDPTGMYQQSGSADIDDLGVWRKALTPLEAASIYMAAQFSGQSFTSAAVLPLTIQPVGGGQLQLNWTEGFSLKAADKVTGPFTLVKGAKPGYTITPSGTAKFYRLAY